MPPGSLNLKQRLAAIATAHTSSSTSVFDDVSQDSPRSATQKRRPFNFPMPQRRSTQDSFRGSTSEDQLQEILSKIIFQAGVDYESVVCYAFTPSFDEPL
jgi:Rho GTPase-activating protein 1